MNFSKAKIENIVKLYAINRQRKLNNRLINKLIKSEFEIERRQGYTFLETLEKTLASKLKENNND